MQTPDSDKLRVVQAESYRALHAAGAYRHKGPPPHLLRFLDCLGREAVRSRARVLDYGCGPDGGLLRIDRGLLRIDRRVLDLNVVGYDPHVPEYSAAEVLGWDYHAVHSADVLEHLTVAQVGEFFDVVAAIAPRLVYLVVSLRPANKHLCNGLNAHLTIEPLPWWQGFAQARLPGYVVVAAETDHMGDAGTLALRRRGAEDAAVG
jgi:hypothetical protein